MVQSLGFIETVLDTAGPRARRDLLTSAPPMFVAGRLAALFRPVQPRRRGVALLTATGAALTLLTVGLWLL